MNPLFSGTLHFVQLIFDNGGTPALVSDPDMAVVIQWAQLAVVPISNFASRFGPNTLNVSPNVISWNVPPPDGSSPTYFAQQVSGTWILNYGNPDLWQWLDAIVTEYALPAGDALVVLNPYTQNVNCSDISTENGVYGVHGGIQNPLGMSLANVGYRFCFANVGTNSPFDVGDSVGQYAWQLSHEIEEMTVNPYANGNPEVADPSAGHDFFAMNGSYIQSSPSATPAPAQYGFWIVSMALPAKQLCTITDAGGRLSVFYTGLDDVIYRSSEIDPGEKTGMIRGVLLGAPWNKALQLVAGCNVDDRVEVFYIGTDNIIRHNYQMGPGATSAWSGEELFTNSALTAKQIALGTNADGRLELFYIGMDDILYHAWQLNPGGGTGWSGGDFVSTSQNTAQYIGVASNADGRLELFYIGMDNILYHDWQLNPVTGTSWSGGKFLSTAQNTAKSLVVGNNADGRLEVFYIGMDDIVYHDWQMAPITGTTWSGGILLGATPFSAQQLAVAQNATEGSLSCPLNQAVSGPLEVFFIGLDGNLYYSLQSSSAPGGWTVAAPLQAANQAQNSLTAVSAVSVARNGICNLDVSYVRSDTLLLHIWQAGPGGQYAWNGNETVGSH